MTSHAKDFWQETNAFSFSADIEKRPLNRQVKEAKGAILPNREFLKSHKASSLMEHHASTGSRSTGPQSGGGHHGVNEQRYETAADGELSFAGAGPIATEKETSIHIALPEWLPDRSYSGAIAFATGLVAGMYAKCGGDEAVMVVDGNPPVTLLNPFGLAPMRDQPFIDLVTDISLKLYPTAEDSEGRQKVAQELANIVAKAQKGAIVQATPLLGSCIVVRQDTIDRVGIAPFLQGFDLLWICDYLGSKEGAIKLSLVYNGALYHELSASNWMQVVKAIAFQPDLNVLSVNDLPALDAEMEYRLIEQWQPSQFNAREYTTTLPHLFRETMKDCCGNNPSKQIAIIEPRIKRYVTYKEFDDLSTKVAMFLHDKCAAEKDRFGEDCVIGVYLPRCADWYILMLGIHKAGGAYLSLDPEFPPDRLSYALEDSSSMALFTLASMKNQLEYKNAVFCIDELWEEINKYELPDGDAANFVSPTRPHSPAYLIYTSGSTGKPKGVLIEHINAVNFVISERKLFKLNNKQRVIQGFSTSFDASVEEIWLAFASGSSLIVVEKTTMADSDALMDLINEYEVTVLSTVPTLLATMEPEKLERLELVIVGGEACNKEVVEMYATGGRRQFVNSYGPTEATVACCADFLTPSQSVTIGRAQPGYVAYILNDQKQLVAPGVPGELCMAGPSVARGYVNRPDLTKEKFVHCPFHETYDRMYCTGDLVRWNVEGRLEFLGRIDSQVKLRGFRIEVGEIENVLSTFPGVTTAVVVLRNDAGVPYLAAYLVCEPELEDNFDEGAFRKHLKSSLPVYMIPQRFVPITTIPRSPAGKLDRKGFPEPPAVQVREDENEGPKEKPSTPTEFLLHEIWSKFLPAATNLAITDNFFEVGGQSLLAGKVSGAIRKSGFDQFSIRYLYSHPTIKELASAMDSMATLKRPDPACTTLPMRFQPSPLRRVCFLMMQIFVMHCTFFFAGGYLFFFLWLYSLLSTTLTDQYGLLPGRIMEAMVLTVCGFVASLCYMLILVPLLKWTLIGKYKQGTHSIWSLFFLRWWCVRLLNGLAFTPLYQSTVILNTYMRLMGAKVGLGVIFSGSSGGEFDLLEIGSDSWVGTEALISTSEIVDSMLMLRKVKIGSCSSIGTRCVIKGGSVIGDEVIVQHMSCIHENVSIPSGEMWGGSPATKIGLSPTLSEQLPSRDIRNARFNKASAYGNTAKPGTQSASINDDYLEAPLLGGGGASAADNEPKAIRASLIQEGFFILGFMLYLITIITLCFTPLFTVYLFVWTKASELPENHQYWLVGAAFGATPIVMAVILIYVHLILVALRWIVLPWNPQPGFFPVNSSMFYRKLMFDCLMKISLTLAHPLYASIYIQYFLRALGTEIGARAECSNLFGFTPGLTKLGKETFVADFVAVNPPEIFRGVMHLGRVEIGDRAFAGNGSVLPPNSKLHERSLLGLLSFPTKDLEADSTYIGSPAFLIPRPTAANASATGGDATYAPPCWLYFARCTWEFFRAITPLTYNTWSVIGGFIVCTQIEHNIFSIEALAKVYSLLIWLVVVFSMFLTLATKWLIVGKEKPANYPLWSAGVWKAEFVVDIQTTVGGLFAIFCRGTPLLPIFFKAMGAKIGSDCYFDSIFITEPDMVTIGSNVCIGDRVTIQTHLFEDRVMKIDTLSIEDRVSVGALSIILYNSHMERGVTVGSLSLVMKGESYPAGTHWEGVPAQRRGVPSVMVVAPPSAPRIAVAPPTKKSQKETVAAARNDLGPDLSPDDIVALKDWLLDDGQ